jgi:hypothetical protein
MEVRHRIGPGRGARARAAAGSATALLMLVIAAGLAGCTRPARVVQWNEEVLLNTGETIWVHRDTSYRWGNSTPVATNWSYERDRQNTIAFEYRGKRCAYRSEATLQVLAISPAGTPNLVISAAHYRWQWDHDYRCVRPSYVQLQPAGAATQRRRGPSMARLGRRAERRCAPHAGRAKPLEREQGPELGAAAADTPLTPA